MTWSSIYLEPGKSALSSKKGWLKAAMEKLVTESLWNEVL